MYYDGWAAFEDLRLTILNISVIATWKKDISNLCNPSGEGFIMMYV